MKTIQKCFVVFIVHTNETLALVQKLISDNHAFINLQSAAD